VNEISKINPVTAAKSLAIFSRYSSVMVDDVIFLGLIPLVVFMWLAIA
jgi:hypothetical protein